MTPFPAKNAERLPSFWTLVKAVLATLVFVLLLGGCTWSPFSSGKDKDKADAGTDAAPELEHCTLKLSACRNSCYKSGAGSACLQCCGGSADACDRGESYSFYACPDAE